MSRSRSPLEQGSLFDLELDEEERPAPAEDEDGALADSPDPDETDASDSPALEVPLERSPAAPRDAERGEPREDAAEDRSPVGPRFLAGGLDAGLHLLLGGALAGGVALLGVAIEPRSLTAVGLVLLLFSFFYTVISLAFWGATPGMAALDLVAEAEAGEPLAFGQAARRWLAGVLTVAAAGLPSLLVLTGRSLADRWSGSSIVQG